MNEMSVVRTVGWLARYRGMDPVSQYICVTSAGIVWVLALGKLFYFNPLTHDKASVWGMWSFNFIKPWMIRFPSDGPKMKLAVLPKETVAEGAKPKIQLFRERFMAHWEKNRSSSRTIFRLMLPWWGFTHAIQIPRKYVQFLPPMLISNLLQFLDDGTVPITMGYKLMVLAALRMICDKSAQALYLFSASNEGTQPAILGAQSMILKKMQTISPRARAAVSAAEIQTVFAKMEGFTAAISMPGQARLLIDLATLPLGYFFLYRLFGLPAIGVSIAANVGISALAARVGTQEGILNELAANLPIWKLYGWSNFFIDKLNKLTAEMETAGRWNATWKTLAEVLPGSVGPTAVLISVGINVLLGGEVLLVKLLTAGQYISIISFSMQSLTESRQQWKDLCVECKNIDQVLELPDSEPLQRSSDGSIQLTNASFGWPTKPPAVYSVTAKGTTCTPVTGGQQPALLQQGELVESVDGQKKGRTDVRVRTKDGSKNGWVKLSALKKLPAPKLADWVDPAAGVAELNLHVTQGELVLISGPVAGGKSTLLQSLVGNTEKLGGEIVVPKSVAFQPQSPILFDQTIRANILFGISDADANEEWIQQSLTASTLSLDMDDPESTLHAKRELTSAGQKGSELSGGQQARVALARCIYAALAGSECLILDDPIKALDPATAAKCWDEGIKGTMAGKTRVLVVNSQMLQRFASDAAVDRLIIVENEGKGSAGRVTYNGKPSGMPQSIQDRLGDGYNMSANSVSPSGAAEPVPVSTTPVKSAAPPAGTPYQTPMAAPAKRSATFQTPMGSVAEGSPGDWSPLPGDWSPVKFYSPKKQQEPSVVAAYDGQKQRGLVVHYYRRGGEEPAIAAACYGQKQPTAMVQNYRNGHEESSIAATCYGKKQTTPNVQTASESTAAPKTPKTTTPARPAAKVAAAAKKPPKQSEPKPKPKQQQEGSIPGSVIAYCKRMGPWIVVSAVGMVLTQAANLGLYAWYEKWAKDAWGLGFRKNYAIALGVMLGAQFTRLFQGITDGVGGEGATKSIRLDVNKKLSVLAMPYLWDPSHSTAQLVDLVTKDPNEYRLFAMMPLLLSSAAFSLSAVLYAKPIITPVAVVCLIAYKYVKKPFGWGIRQVYGGLIIEAWVGMRKFSGEMFDASPTIRAMGRTTEFESLINGKYYERLFLSPLYFGAIGRSNFYGMAVDTVWATISMAVVVSMRGQIAPAIAIAVYNQLEELNSLIGNFFSLNDAAAQTLPNWIKIQELLEVKECVGKSCIEHDTRPPPAGWPANGAIEMQNIYFDYRTDAPCALNGVSVSIQSGEKIGVCGRTGAGKSTLLSVLFSLGPLNNGTVSIGGRDLSGISCHEVRANVAIVPQSPTLFDGTVRENLIGGNRQAGDSDEYLLETLRTCRLAVLAERGLDGTMGQLSDGQRQLFCVARALVRRPKILVLDESTADLDQDSANELLRVIDENFQETTVISIAHRLNFIRNSDKILVLNTGGTINAFDTPAKLLADKEGYFARQMAEENSGM